MKVKKKDRIVKIFKDFFSYTTVKEAKTYNLKIAIVYRSIQFIVIWYVIGYVKSKHLFHNMGKKGGGSAKNQSFLFFCFFFNKIHNS